MWLVLLPQASENVHWALLPLPAIGHKCISEGEERAVNRLQKDVHCCTSIKCRLVPRAAVT